MQTAFRIEELTAGYENNTIFENLNENKPVINKIKQNIYPKLLEPP